MEACRKPAQTVSFFALSPPLGPIFAAADGIGLDSTVDPVHCPHKHPVLSVSWNTVLQRPIFGKGCGTFDEYSETKNSDQLEAGFQYL